MAAPDAGPRFLEHLLGRQGEMIRLLSRLVEAESPSLDPLTQTGPQGILRAEFERLGFVVRHVPGQTSGGQLLAIPHARPKRAPLQLLIGHCDTVWPLGTLASMPVRLREGRLYGPGAYDMKGGLVNIVFALRALQALNVQPRVVPIVFVNSDEELGSHDSAPHIRRLARVVERVWVLEPALGPLGKLKTARKGNGFFEVRVIGRAAHAGLEPEKGASAILELSLVIQRLFALNDPERGITVNVGTIDGGLRTNIIAPESRATVDVRVATSEDATWLESQILSLQATTPGTELVVTGAMNRPPMEKTAANVILWDLAREQGRSLGLELEDGRSGGGSDGNITSLYTPTLDGLGPVGDGAHASHEHVLVDSLPRRAALLATLLAAPSIADQARESGVRDPDQAGALLRGAGGGGRARGPRC